MVTVSWRWLPLVKPVLRVLEGSMARGVIMPTSRGSNLVGDSFTLLRETAESEWREDTELLVSSVMDERKGVLSVTEGEPKVAGSLETPFAMTGFLTTVTRLLPGSVDFVIP